MEEGILNNNNNNKTHAINLGTQGHQFLKETTVSEMPLPKSLES